VAAGCDIRILLLEGQGIDRTIDAYKMLDYITYCGDVNNATADSFYHADDAAGTIRNIAGDYLILPDMRGYATRGLDKSGLVDPQGAGRIVGSVQNDALQNITGDFDIRAGNPNIVVTNGVFNIVVGGGATLASADSVTPPNAQFDRVDFNASTSINPNPAKTDNAETRMKNIAVRYGIYY